MVAKLLDKRIGDVLSLRSGYDTSKVTFRWDGSKGELSVKFDSGASISEIKTTLGLLELDTKVASSASTRKVRIFPTLSVVPGFRYRFDETTGTVHYYVNDTVFQSFLLDGKIFARLVEVEESPPNPILWVDSGKFQTTSLRRLVLSEYHIRLDDVDTRDPSDDTKVDGSEITFRVRGISGAKLQHLFEGNWRDIPSRNQIQEFTLRQLREGLVSLLPNAAGTLTFEIQAADDDSHLSDSDYYDNEDDADPLGVSIRVVALKEIYAGKEMPVSDDRRATGRRWRSHAQRCNAPCLDRRHDKRTTESACEAGGWKKRRCALSGGWTWSYHHHVLLELGRRCRYWYAVSAERRHSYGGRFSGGLERPCVADRAFSQRKRSDDIGPPRYCRRSSAKGLLRARCPDSGKWTKTLYRRAENRFPAVRTRRPRDFAPFTVCAGGLRYLLHRASQS